MENNKRLIYVLNHYSATSSSHFFHVINLLKEIASNGVEIALIIEKCDTVPEFVSDNIKVYPIIANSTWDRYKQLAKLAFQLSKQGYNKIFIRITLITTSLLIILSWFTKQRIFYWHSGAVLEQFNEMPFGPDKIKDFLKSRLPFRFVSRFTDRFVTGPESMIDYYVDNGYVQRKKMLLLYNDIDLQRFSSQPLDQAADTALRNKFDIPEGTKVGLFVHRMSPVRKTGMYLPLIFDRYFASPPQDIVFILAGDGPERQELERIINSKPYTEQVKFIGNVPNKDISDLYRLADVFINPTFAEGFPRVLIEAMACGLPVVTTDAGGIRDILGQEQLAFMTKKEDPNAFAACMINLLANEAKQQLLSKENLTTVKQYDTKVVAQMYTSALFNHE